MKKRILSFLLALLMVVSIFPAPAYATDSTDVTITPTETTETSCPTCGTVGCTSEHLNWCSDCQKDNCGQNHCDTCGAIDCTTEHKICDKCGTLDCTADHTNWCADCKVDNCGQNHCPTCRTIDCTKEHKACETCSVIDCTADHTNWCNICKVDNCGKTHVYCETCQKYDCGENHNATEPTEPATESVAPIDEGDEEETHPMMGKIVTLVESPGLLQAIENPTVSTAGYIVGVNAYPKYMEIEAVVTVGSATYYQLKAADTADNDWPDYYGTSYEHYWLPSTQVTETELPKPCPVCNEYGCTTEHKQCEICGEYDCKAVHFWCDLCEEYDCGKSHLICPACGEVDCTETHTWCPYCADYDCDMQHEDEHKPDTTPVIPANPQILPGEDVTVVDEFGDALTDGLVMLEGEKTSISAWPNGSADSYQWQVCINNSSMRWADIQGATSKGLLVSPAMFLSIIDYYGSTYVRCVATVGGETKVSDPIPVIVEEAVPQEQVMMFAAAPRSGNSDDAAPTAEDGNGVKYSIIIEFKFPNGDTAAQAYTANLSAGADYILDVECPAVVGYKPDRERITETITSISGNLTYTVTYQPDYVDYKVVHHQQNIGDNNYTAVKTETKTGLTGSPVGTGLEKDYDGFYDLIYDSGITVAADGSTVINIYYDRYYYLVSLDMNGGFGVEPIYARYATPINSAAWLPQRTGYSFTGWSPALPSEVPIGGSSHVAQWTKADTGFTVAFWYENADNEDYTFVGSVQKTATTGTTVNGSTYAALNSVDNAEHFNGFNADYAKHFSNLNVDKTDENITVKADGTTVVNVYFYRNVYTLTYYEFVCPHIDQSQHTSACCSLTEHTSHTSACCSIPYHTHSSSCCNKTVHTAHTNSCCSIAEHTHTDDCCANIFHGLAHWPASQCDTKNCGGQKEHTHGDGSCSYTKCSGIHDHSSGCNTTNCGNQTVHTHASGCDSKNCSVGYTHTHGSGCNTSACPHNTSYLTCPCTSNSSIRNNPANWVIGTIRKGEKAGQLAQASYKYGADISQFHANMGNLRWCPGVSPGFPDVTAAQNYGQILAMGTLSAMPGGDSVLYRKTDSIYQYYIHFWLETADGKASATSVEMGGKHFEKQDVEFTPKMGGLDYDSDYVNGLPYGFKYWQEWACDDNWNPVHQMSPGETIGEEYKNFNFYYARLSYTLRYFNGENEVATASMLYEEPLTNTYNLQNLTMTSPYGSGYYFAGWCLDADCTIPVSWGSTKMPEGGMAVYAKWLPMTHTVTTYQTKGGTKLGEYTVTHGETVDNAPGNPTRDGYNFVTWLYEEDATVKAYNFSMPVYKDMVLYAEWTSDSLASGTITYVDKDTGKAIAEPTPITGLVGASKTYSAKTGTELDSGYQTGYFPAVSSHNIEFGASESQNNWIFYYTKMDDVAYTVRYLEKDTNKVLHEETSGTSNAGKITITHITITGYAADAYSKDLVLSSDPALNVVTFYYTKDEVHAPVQVEHYIQNTTGTGYTHYFTEQPYNGNIGETQTAVPLTLTGFTYNKSGNSINGVELTASGLVLKLYYDRNTYDYTFRFMVDGTTTKLRDDVTGSGLYGAQVSYVAPSIPGYDLTTSGSLTVTISNDETANVRTFYYEEDTVTIQYQVGSVKGGTVVPASETVLAVNGDPAGSSATADEDHVFVGWYTTYACNGTAVSTDANFEPSKNSYGVYEAKTYYAKFEEVKVTIRYAVEMPESAEAAATLTKTSEQVSILSGKAEGSAVDTIPEKYEFAGWYDADGNKVGDSVSYVPTMSGDKWVDGTTFTAKFVEQKATINYVAVGNGSVTPATEEVNMVTGEAVGATATATENVARFVGWYDNAACEGTALSTDAAFAPELPSGGWEETQTYYAKFEKIQYTITWLNDDDSVIDTTTVAYGEVPTHADPSKAATAEYTYTFAGWSPEVAAVTGEATYKATYTAAKNKYTIIWKNEDGTVLETDTGVEYGTMPSYDGETPTKEPYNQYTYIFRAWSPEIVAVTGDAVYIASFDPHENFYTVTWVNHNDEVLETDENVAWDSMPEYNGDTPEKTGNAEHSYTFAGWSPTVSKVNGHATYTATFAESVNTYTVTWKNEDGTVLETDEDMVYGAMPSYDGETPEKAATAQYTYTFDGWDKEVVAVTGDVTYTAKYKETVNKYTVTFVDEDGTTILMAAAEYEYGTAAEDIVKPTDPTKEATAEFTYSFAGWTPEIAAVTANVTYKATYTEVKNQYTLSGEIDHGTVTDPVTVDYGTQAKITFTPAIGYKFHSWKVNDGADTLITTPAATWSYEDPQLTESKHVVVTMAPIEYTIAYELDGGSLPEGVTNPGTYTIETLTFTLNNPTRAGYKFKGWATSESATTGKETVTIEKGTTGDKTFYAIWERSLVDLTITTTSADQEQSYIFTVSGTPSDSSYGTITLDVVLVGTDSITIKDLPVGEYTVTEKDDWSWRENAVESKTADLRTASQTVSFDFGVVDDLHWLSGYSYKRKKGGS